MGFVKIIPAFLLVGLVVSPAVVAQNRQEVRRHQRVSLPKTSTPQPTTPRSTSTGATGTVSRSGGWRGSGVAPRSSYGRLNEGYTGYTQCRRVLSDHSRYVYSPYKLGGFDNCALFISRLWQHKGVAPGQYLWRYAQGDSPLTPELLRVALSDSMDSAGSVIQSSRRLTTLLDDYEAGRLGRKEFERAMKKQTSEIRDLADKIRDDRNLRYVDQRRDVKSKSRRAVQTMPELRVLVGELQELSRHLKREISVFYEQDLTRVISVNELQKPSLRSVSKGVDKLAKAIEKSVQRL